MRALLIVDRPGLPPRTLELTEGRALTAGSDPTCSVSLAGAGLAPVHLRIEHHDGRLLLRQVSPGLDTRVNQHRVRSCLLRHGDQIELGSMRLEVRVQRTPAPFQVPDPPQDAVVGATRALVAAIEARDTGTRGHSERVAAYALAMAEVLGLSGATREVLELAGLFHDVGKIGLSEALLNKPAQLDPGERRVVQRHAAQGAIIVRHLPHPGVAEITEAVRHHHERWDGGGYPDRLPGAQSGEVARILAVADTWDAMTSPRPYRAGIGKADACGILVAAAGSQLDPWAVAAFMEADRQGWVEAAPRLRGPAAESRFLTSPEGLGEALSSATLVPAA
ncbi:MAG: HD domain-containing phosphohydrolase [Pseudomonadota bacterium]